MTSSSHSRVLLGVGALAAVAGLSAWLAAGSRQLAVVPARLPTPGQTGDAAAQAEARSSATVKALLSEVQRLRERVQTLEMSQAEAAETEPPSSEDNAEQAVALLASPEELAENRAQVRAGIDAALASEAPDPNWTRATRGQLAQAFDGAHLQGVELKSVDCGATFCRVVAGYEGAKERSNFEEFAAGRGMSALVFPTKTEDGKLASIAYLVRRDRDAESHVVWQFGATL